MTDTTVRVSQDTRKRLKVYAAKNDITNDEAIQQLLDEADA